MQLVSTQSPSQFSRIGGLVHAIQQGKRERGKEGKRIGGEEREREESEREDGDRR